MSKCVRERLRVVRERKRGGGSLGVLTLCEKAITWRLSVFGPSTVLFSPKKSKFLNFF